MRSSPDPEEPVGLLRNPGEALVSGAESGAYCLLPPLVCDRAVGQGGQTGHVCVCVCPSSGVSSLDPMALEVG